LISTFFSLFCTSAVLGRVTSQNAVLKLRLDLLSIDPSGTLKERWNEMPQSLSMHQLPTSATGQVSAAKEYEYAKLQNNEVLLINPKDRQVEEIIMPPSTTGSAKK